MTDKQKSRLTKAKAGEIFSTAHGKQTALPACEGHEGKDFAGNWYCITHKEMLFNNFHKDQHIERGKHHMIWFCTGHGFEQP